MQETLNPSFLHVNPTIKISQSVFQDAGLLVGVAKHETCQFSEEETFPNGESLILFAFLSIKINQITATISLRLSSVAYMKPQHQVFSGQTLSTL